MKLTESVALVLAGCGAGTPGGKGFDKKNTCQRKGSGGGGGGGGGDKGGDSAKKGPPDTAEVKEKRRGKKKKLSFQEEDAAYDEWVEQGGSEGEWMDLTDGEQRDFYNESVGGRYDDSTGETAPELDAGDFKVTEAGAESKEEEDWIDSRIDSLMAENEGLSEEEKLFEDDAYGIAQREWDERGGEEVESGEVDKSRPASVEEGLKDYKRGQEEERSELARKQSGPSAGEGDFKVTEAGAESKEEEDWIDSRIDSLMAENEGLSEEEKLFEDDAYGIAQREWDEGQEGEPTSGLEAAVEGKRQEAAESGALVNDSAGPIGPEEELRGSAGEEIRSAREEKLDRDYQAAKDKMTPKGAISEDASGGLSRMQIEGAEYNYKKALIEDGISEEEADGIIRDMSSRELQGEYEAQQSGVYGPMKGFKASPKTIEMQEAAAAGRLTPEQKVAAKRLGLSEEKFAREIAAGDRNWDEGQDLPQEERE